MKKNLLSWVFSLGVVAVLFLAAPVYAGGGGPVITKILTSNHQVQDGESFTLQAYSSGQYKVATFNLYLDGKLFKTCKGKKVCGGIYGPFSGDDAGQHRYDIVVTDIKGTESTRQWGYFWVNATADESGEEDVPTSRAIPEPAANKAPEVPTALQMTTNKNAFVVGEKLNLSVAVRSKSPVLFIDVIVDGQIIKTCTRARSCVANTRPFTNNSVGEHKYMFNIVNASGGVNRPWGMFSVTAPVVGRPAPAPQPQPTRTPANQPTRSSQIWPSFDKIITSGHQLYPGDKFSMKIFATDEKGVSDIEVVLDERVIVKCSGATCEAEVGPFADADIGEHKYSFRVTNQDGNQINPWGKFWVNKKEVATPTPNPAPVPTPVPTPAPAPTVSVPTITSVTTNGNAFNMGESLVLKVLAKDAKGFAKILIQIDGTPVLLCPNNDGCGTIVGPFAAKDAGEHTYTFTVTNLDGQTATTWGKYTVAEKDVEAPNVTVSADKDTMSSSDKINISASATDNVSVAKIELLVNAKLVRTCVSAECKYTGGPYPTYEGTSISYAATAYDAAGNIKTTGYKSVQITKPVVTR